MSAAAQRLRYRDTAVDLVGTLGPEVDRTLQFLSTHLAVEDVVDGDPVATVRFADTVDARHLPPASAEEEEIFVRRSASDFFTIPAVRATVGTREFLHCTRTGTRMVLDHASRVVDVVVGEGGWMDVVELLRDLVGKDQENRGAVLLHASAAVGDEGVVLVTGAKGAGKSTVLLELVEHGDLEVLSGDKVMLHLDDAGVFRASGWPDYPHLGYATVVKYDGLARIAGLDAGQVPPPDHAFSPVGKFAVDPFGFRERFAGAAVTIDLPVAAAIHPTIGPGHETVVSPLAVGAEDLAVNVESTFDGAHAGWHHLLSDERDRHTATRDRLLTALAALPAWSLRGPGDLAERAQAPWGRHLEGVS